MAFSFRRNKSQDITPTISGPYQATTRERVGVAWLLAFATLAVTIMLAFVFYFGGRLAWRTAFDNDSSNESATQQQDSADSDSTAPAVQDVPKPAVSTPVVDNPVDNNVTPSTTAVAPELANTGPGDNGTAPTELPNTGPDSDL